MPGLGRCFLADLGFSGSLDLGEALHLVLGEARDLWEWRDGDQSSALHFLSPSCPGRSTVCWVSSHPSFPVVLRGSVPEHPPPRWARAGTEHPGRLRDPWIKVGKGETGAAPRCRGGGLSGAPGPPDPRPPLPPPARPVEAGDMENDERVVPRRRQPNGPAPAIGADGPRFVYIWAKRGARVNPCVPLRPPWSVTSAF